MNDAEADAPLATGPLGMELLSFHAVPEETRFDDHPVGYALVVLWHRDRVLMVLERSRRCWELPGGGIEAGETPRQAAVRELREEAGQRLRAEELRFAGFACTALPDHRLMYGALYTAQIEEPEPFAPNDEVSAVHWHVEGEPLPESGLLQTVDEYLVARCRPDRP